MGFVCYQLLQILDNVSNAARDSAISEPYQVMMERVTWRSILLTLARIPYCHSSTWCGSLAISCCKYLDRHTMYQTLPHLGRTKSLRHVLK